MITSGTYVDVKLAIDTAHVYSIESKITTAFTGVMVVVLARFFLFYESWVKSIDVELIYDLSKSTYSFFELNIFSFDLARVASAIVRFAFHKTSYNISSLGNIIPQSKLR